MDFFSEISDITLSFIAEHQVLAAFLTPFLGEVGLHVLGVLAGEGSVSFFTIFLASVLGTFLFDVVVFWLVQYAERFPWIQRLRETLYEKAHTSSFTKTIKRVTERLKQFPTMLLFLIKLFPGTRVLIFLYVLMQRPSFGVFLIRSLVATSCWALALLLPGFLVGIGFATLHSGYTVWIVLGYLIITVTIGYCAGNALQRMLLWLATQATKVFDTIKKRVW